MVHLTLEDLPIELAEKVIKLLKKEGYDPKSTRPKILSASSAADGEDRPNNPPR